MEADDPRPDGDFLAKELYVVRPVQDAPPQGALGLVAHKQDGGLRTPEVVLQVVADAARVTHAGGGYDDLGPGVQVQLP